ncbi:DUF393 domain-containing protein [Bradyrhizobium tropiciagri]|uniref:DCC1-like thiol-disulfide oxidoreductase family protein n=1 Tax=Bradyrhizobium tropiciagri TaxID=312253 RepID=UPI001BADC89A|nr:DCC1-like thiol-disulfide oxidoreductase family protein [Bradyrhizobium tropiciagri]MBR0875093.1 DUF393 domain-containing protein [Bradyrhizobium tropiciagri]
MHAPDTTVRFSAALKLAAVIAGLIAVLVAAGAQYPVINAFTGGILISGLLLVAGLPRVAGFCARILGWLDRIALAANLKEDIDLPREARRINLLRIALGLVFLWRWSNLLPLALAAQDDVVSYVTAFLALLTGVCLTVGFFTPVATMALLLGAVFSFDLTFSAGTLGTHVLLMTNLPLLLFPAGTALSLDARLMTSPGVLGSMVRGLYGLLGKPTMQRSRIGRLLAVTSYSGLCLYSILWHLDDPAWLKGYANLQVMTSFYLSRYPDFFQWLYHAYPSIALLLSRTSIYLIMIWEMFFWVFLFGSFTRYYVLWIGAIFLCISGFLLQLSYLPWVEMVFFTLVFWQDWWLNVGGRRSLTVFFDDRCRLCDGTMRFLSRVDLFAIVTPSGLSRSKEEVAAAGLTEDEVMEDLCARAGDGKLYRGYDLYLELSRRVLLLLPAWPLLLIGKLTGLGPLLYRAIAARRRRIFGTCSPSTITADDFRPVHAADIAAIPQRLLWPSAFALAYLSLLVCYVAGTLPYSQSLWLKYPATSVIYGAAFNYGLVPINVFNKQDLAMENNFATIEAHRADAPGEEFLLPYLDKNGRRLAWNRSDRFYFGNSVLLRRSMIAYRNYCFLDPDRHLDIFRPLLKLASAQGYVAPYKVTYYSIPRWDYAQIRDPAHKSFVPNKVCEITLGDDLSVKNRTEFVPVNIPDTN